MARDLAAMGPVPEIASVANNEPRRKCGPSRLAPHVLKRFRRHRCVAHRVGDAGVAKEVLTRRVSMALVAKA